MEFDDGEICAWEAVAFTSLAHFATRILAISESQFCPRGPSELLVRELNGVLSTIQMCQTPLGDDPVPLPPSAPLVDDLSSNLRDTIPKKNTRHPVVQDLGLIKVDRSPLSNRLA